MKNHTRRLKLDRIAPSVALAIMVLSLVTTPATAAPPLLSKTSVSQVTEKSAILESTINPGGRATKYRFEYVNQTDFEVGGFAAAVKVPIPEGKLAAVEEGIVVAASIGALSPATTYHYRLLASNSQGSVEGSQQSFATYSTPSIGLPDDRAYEQASPPEKNGSDTAGRVAFVKAGADGDAVTFLSTAGFPGGTGEQELPVYLARRIGGEWSTQGLLPSAGEGSRAHVIGWTSDFSDVFDTVAKLGTPPTESLLSRSSNGGELAPIASHEGEFKPKFVGASAGGSEVIFESTAALASTPAAIVGKSNIYAWDRTSNAVSLAGVLNTNEPPTQGAVAGPYDWIRGATQATLGDGGASRDYYTQDNHAVSVAGSLYFTAAGTGQLYLRRNPTQPQSKLDGGGSCVEPDLACTVHVSGSQKTNGKGPGGSDVTGPYPAAFMAATSDGATALFTSAEALTNGSNTGPEPGLPAIARADVDGSNADPTFLPASATGVALDGSHLYWANGKSGTIGRADLDGSNLNSEFVKGVGTPRWVAVDASHLYWTNDANGEDGEGTIGRANLDGSEAEAEFIKGASNPQGIAVDAGHIYWANHGVADGAREVMRTDIDGTNPDRFSFGETENGQPRQWNALGLAVDGVYGYFTNGQIGIIRRVELTEPKNFDEILSTGSTDRFQGLAVNGPYIYWANAAPGTSGAIGRAKLNNPAPNVTEIQTEFIKGAGHPDGLSADGVSIYWSANQDVVPNPGNDLYSYEVKSGKLSDLTVDHGDSNGAEVKGVLGSTDDGSYVYFAANGDLDGGGPAVLGDCTGPLSSASGSCNLYLWHDSAISFVARLNTDGSGAVNDAVNWTGTPTKVDTNLEAILQKTARVSADGRTLLFRSQEKLTSYENKGAPEFYRYRVGDPGLICVSCNPTGAAPVSTPTLGTVNVPALFPATPASVLSRNLSADGGRFFFETAEALVVNDTNNRKDVYEWEENGLGSCRSEVQDGGCIFLISSGQSPEPSLFADASASGANVFFFTRQGLVGQDKDRLFDVYDARVAGGIAAQSPPPPEACEAEGCKPAAKPPSTFESLGTPFFSGPGNVKPKRHKGKPRHGKRKKQKHRRQLVHTNRGAHR